jgi:oligopeptide/dipeptide ABC transporter ATP-binding protein
VQAAQDVSFSIPDGGSLALVGESGSGKTTIGRCLLRLLPATAGKVFVDDVEVLGLAEAAFQPYRRRMQVVFQDPYSSLNPRLAVGRAVAEPLVVHGLASKKEALLRAGEALDQVGMPLEALNRYPHEFSGGQRQRICIARALVLDPDFLMLDEPVSALDVSIQAQILNLLLDIRSRRRLAFLLISHNLAVVRQVCDWTAVLYLGRLIEYGETARVFAEPRHPYTRALLAAVPGRGVSPEPLSGEVPSAADPPPGCPFVTRCPLAVTQSCRETFPPLAGDDGHQAACWLAGQGGR